MGTLAPAEVDFVPPLVHSLVSLLRLRGKNVSEAFIMARLVRDGQRFSGNLPVCRPPGRTRRQDPFQAQR